MGERFFQFDTDSQWDYENGYNLTSHPTRIAKLVAHYELYKSIVDLPGCVVECGVYKGASLLRFATFREMLENPYSRCIIGFDAFGKFPEQVQTADQAYVQNFERVGGEGIPFEEFERVLRYKSFHNVELVPGDILTTVPHYLDDHRELKIALLHIDVDVYQPTLTILSSLYDRVVRGGLVVFDDYATVAGETRAVDEFFAGQDVTLRKLPICHVPAYIRK